MDKKDLEPYHTYPNKPIGGGNPYYCCRACGKSDPQINGELLGHYPDCKWMLNKIKELENERIN